MKEITNEESSNAQKNFEIAVQLVKSLPQKGTFQPSYSEAGKIYSYFKQSKFGPCTQARPGFWDVVNRAKWDAWSALGNMSQENAMDYYVEEIKKVYCRIRKIDEFSEQEESFADTLIPFCEVTGLSMSPKVLKIANARKSKENENDHNKNSVNKTPVNGTTRINGTPPVNFSSQSKLQPLNGAPINESIPLNGASMDQSLPVNDSLVDKSLVNRTPVATIIKDNNSINHEHSVLFETVVKKVSFDDKEVHQSIKETKEVIHEQGKQIDSMSSPNNNCRPSPVEEYFSQ